MPATTSALERLAALQANIEELKQTALSELMEKRNALGHQLAEVDAELEKLTGKSPSGKTRLTRAAIVGRTPSLQELTDLLSAVPGKTLNLRKEGIDSKHVKKIARSHPHILRIGGKGPWPEVTLLR